MELIQSIINTLNQIEVKGKDNLDKLLGVIMTLEIMVAKSEETEKPTAEGELTDG